MLKRISHGGFLAAKISFNQSNITVFVSDYARLGHISTGFNAFWVVRFLSTVDVRRGNPNSSPTYSNTNQRSLSDPDDSANLIKEDAVTICSKMWIDSFRQPQKTVTDLISHLRKFELWLMAYQKVHGDEIGTYVPRNAIGRAAMEDLLALRNAVLDGRFKWGSRLNFFVKSPKDRTDYGGLSKMKIKKILSKPQSAPFQDKIVQEVLLLILEPIYEARFSTKSYAFRPGRTPHTVLRVIRKSFAGYLWYIKADLSSILDDLKVGIVMNSLRRDIRDEKVIDLIKAALVTPVITSGPEPMVKKKKTTRMRMFVKKELIPDDEPKPDPYWLETFFGFAPQEAEKVPSWGHCGILSPLLANICLNELDHWLEDKSKEFYCPSNEEDAGSIYWPEFVPSIGPDKTRKMDFVRFNGHVLVGIRGPRSDAAALRKQIIAFVDQKYHIKVDNDDLPIEHITKGIMFLDHVLCRQVVYPTLRYTGSGGKIVSQNGVGTVLSVTASWVQCMRHFKKMSFLERERDPNPQPCFRMRYATQAQSNAQMNKLLTTIDEWYKYADNRKQIVNFCSYIVRGSLAKLYAVKFNLRSRAKVYKMGDRTLSCSLRRPAEDPKKVWPDYQNLSRMGVTEAIEGLKFTRKSLVPEPDYTPLPSNWKPDHEKAISEYVMLSDAKVLEELRSCMKTQGLVPPQEYMSMLVWNYKRKAVKPPGSSCSDTDSTSSSTGSLGSLLLESGLERRDTKAVDPEEKRDERIEIA